MTRHNAAVIFKRAADVNDQHLYVSPTLGTDRILLALVVLLQQAQELSHLKQSKPSEVVEVPSPSREQPRRSPRLQQNDAKKAATGYGTAVSGPVAEGLSSSGSRSSGSAGCGSNGSNGSGGSAEVDRETWVIPRPGEHDLSVELYNFGEVGLKRVLVGSGRYGNLLEVRTCRACACGWLVVARVVQQQPNLSLSCVGIACARCVSPAPVCCAQGTIDGQACVVKMFESKRKGSVDAWVRELRAYQQLAAVQGTTVPRVLCSGMFTLTDALFLALSDEGSSLSSTKGCVTDEQRADMVRLVRSVHR